QQKQKTAPVSPRRLLMFENGRLLRLRSGRVAFFLRLALLFAALLRALALLLALLRRIGSLRLVAAGRRGHRLVFRESGDAEREEQRGREFNKFLHLVRPPNALGSIF